MKEQSKDFVKSAALGTWAIIALAIMAVSGCGDPCERPHIELVKDKDGNTVIGYDRVPERPINVSFEVIRRDSTTVVKCTAKYEHNYDDIPNTLQVKVCANGKCGLENGITSTLTYWSAEWDELLDVDSISCAVSQPEYSVCIEGFLTECYVLELIPKKVLLHATAPVEGKCLLNLKDPYDIEYCKGGYWDNEHDRWVCSEGWY